MFVEKFMPQSHVEYVSQKQGQVIKNIWGPGPSSLGRQKWLSEITIEPIKNLGAWARFGGLAPIYNRYCLENYYYCYYYYYY